MTSTSRGQQEDMLSRLNLDPNAFQPYCLKQANNEPPLPPTSGSMEMGQNSKYALDKYLPSAEWKCGVGVSGAERLRLLFY